MLILLTLSKLLLIPELNLLQLPVVDKLKLLKLKLLLLELISKLPLVVLIVLLLQKPNVMLVKLN